MLTDERHPDSDEFIDDEAAWSWVKEAWKSKWKDGAWTGPSMSWNRVVFAGQTAILNACDPNADVLEFKPWITRAIDALEAVLRLMPRGCTVGLMFPEEVNALRDKLQAIINEAKGE